MAKYYFSDAIANTAAAGLTTLIKNLRTSGCADCDNSRLADMIWTQGVGVDCGEANATAGDVRLCQYIRPAVDTLLDAIGDHRVISSDNLKEFNARVAAGTEPFDVIGDRLISAVWLTLRAADGSGGGGGGATWAEVKSFMNSPKFIQDKFGLPQGQPTAGAPLTVEWTRIGNQILQRANAGMAAVNLSMYENAASSPAGSFSTGAPNPWFGAFYVATDSRVPAQSAPSWMYPLNVAREWFHRASQSPYGYYIYPALIAGTLVTLRDSLVQMDVGISKPTNASSGKSYAAPRDQFKPSTASRLSPEVLLNTMLAANQATSSEAEAESEPDSGGDDSDSRDTQESTRDNSSGNSRSNQTEQASQMDGGAAGDSAGSGTGDSAGSGTGDSAGSGTAPTPVEDKKSSVWPWLFGIAGAAGVAGVAYYGFKHNWGADEDEDDFR